MSDQHGSGDLHFLGEQLQRLAVGNAGRRREDGNIEAVPGADGFIFFGPYLPVPPGPYSARMIFAAAALLPAAEGNSGVIFDASWNMNVVGACALDEASLESGVVAFQFEVPAEPKAAEGLELRAHSRGERPFVVMSIDLRRVTTAI